MSTICLTHNPHLPTIRVSAVRTFWTKNYTQSVKFHNKFSFH